MYKPLLHLVRALLHGDRDRAVGVLQAARIDEAILARQARLQQVAGWVFARGEELGLLEAMPNLLREEGRSAFVRQWTRNEVILRSASDVVNALQAKSIESLVLKGPLLCRRLYGNIDRKAISDLDILVRKAQVQEADHVLREAGWILRSHLPLGWGWTTFNTHHAEYWKDDLPLELHWCFARHPSIHWPEADVWARTIDASWSGLEVRALAPEDEYILLVLAMAGDIQRNELKVKSLIDLYASRRALNPRTERTVETIAVTMGCSRLLTACSRLVDSIFEARGEPAVPGLLQRGSRFGWKQKNEVFGWYRGGRLAAWPWWAFSLPTRLLVYREATASAWQGPRQ